MYRFKMITLRTFCLLVLGLISLMISSEITFAQSPGLYVIPKLEGSITLDGKVNEPAWEAIEPLPLVTHWPAYGIEVDRSKTEIRIAYDKDYLYVSCRCYVDPEKISAPTYKRNENNMSTSNVSIVLDTFNDNENALWFSVTPTGSRMDGALSNDGLTANLYWNTIWEAQAVIHETGWSAEMRIPFSSLRFESENGRVELGLIAYRYSAHDVTMQTYPAIPPDWGFLSWRKPSQSQRVELTNIENQNPVFITPYLLGGLDRSAYLVSGADRYQHEHELTYEAGLDVKMGLTNSSTLDLTLNTDFAQVEADDQQINLSRFSLFFPERRQFFLERAAIFDFTFDAQDRLFHSRRIGLSEGQPLRILGGARMITRSQGWDIGLLSMQTARDLGLSSKNNSIIRFRKQLLNPQSYAGGMFTSRIDESGNYNFAYGLDGRFNLWSHEFLKFNIAQTSDSDVNGSRFTHESIRLQTEWERRSFNRLSYKFSYNYSGELYNPGIGFQLRENYMRFGDRVSWGWQPEENSSILSIQTSFNGSLYISNNNNRLESLEYGPSISVTLKRGDLITGHVYFITEDIPVPFQISNTIVIPEGLYSFPEAQLSYHTPRGKNLRAVFRTGGGGFFGGTRFTASIQPTWDPSRVVNLNLYYQVNRINFSDRNEDLTAHIVRFRTELTFNTKVTLSSFVQFNSVDDLGILNFRFRYNPKDGNNFYLVFNESMNTFRDMGVPQLPLSESRALLLKYDYTF